MVAAARFVEEVAGKPVAKLSCRLYGSLASTGKGHGTDRAIVLGFMGYEPATVEVNDIHSILKKVQAERKLILPHGSTIEFDMVNDLDFSHDRPKKRHPNGMQFEARNAAGALLHQETVYSLGGGFVVSEDDWDSETREDTADVAVPFPFNFASELLEHCEGNQCSISDVAMANEAAFRSESETREQLDAIWAEMQACVDRGCKNEGVLPGGLDVRRRAPALFNQLTSDGVKTTASSDMQADEADAKADIAPLPELDWINLFALAVNEENAAGGRVVTAPTNGAAGIIPAVLLYAVRFCGASTDEAIHRFLLTAGSIAWLYKKNASISGADVGCQGEVGVACSMAAAALAELLGGSAKQAACAAEIGMEHNLGLTCDPIKGLVQVPCIERNAMGSVKAINAARLALKGDGDQIVSLDTVIETMRQTGEDMMSKYKETSEGGLAVHVVEC